LAVMQAEAVVGVPRVDEEMVIETARLGFDRELLMDSIRSRAQNKATVTYYLLCDNKRRLPSSGYLKSELSEGVPPQQLPPAGIRNTLQPSNVPQQRLLVERKWRLGMHGRGHPSTLMAELYRVLQKQGISWKKMSPYNLKCRKVVKVPRTRSSMSDDDDDDQLVGDSHMDMGHERTVESSASVPQTQEGSTAENRDSDVAADEMVLKFECQMYKSRDDEYLVDVQRLSGDAFIYMDIVSKLIVEMRV